MQKLLHELRVVDPPLSYPVTWKESQRLPYLRAVIEESLRLFPAIGLSLEREVPASGLAMPDGYVLPLGTAVGVNAWAVHRQESTFGPLPTDQFLPERWLKMERSQETQQDYEARLAGMRRVMLAFGWGKRICMGRNISYLEIYKVIPTLLLEFEIGLADPAKEWDTMNRFFVRQKGMECWLRSRGRGNRHVGGQK
jgi:cytochrome P450